MTEALPPAIRQKLMPAHWLPDNIMRMAGKGMR